MRETEMKNFEEGKSARKIFHNIVDFMNNEMISKVTRMQFMPHYSKKLYLRMSRHYGKIINKTSGCDTQLKQKKITKRRKNVSLQFISQFQTQNKVACRRRNRFPSTNVILLLSSAMSDDNANTKERWFSIRLHSRKN